MPPPTRASLLVLLLVFTGCDVIYDRPEIDFSTDFGEPYEVLLRNDAPGVTASPPYVTADARLVVDVAYRSGCAVSRFSVQARQRDTQTAELWLRHRAEAGSCEAGEVEERRLTLPLPTAMAEVPRLVLLLPDRSTLTLDRVY